MAHEDPQQQRELLAGAIGPDYSELEESFASAPGRGRESYVRLTRYAEYLREAAAGNSLDPASAGPSIDVIGPGVRAVVTGTVIAVTEQLPRVADWLAGLGSSIVSQEDDPDLGISRLGVDPFDADSLYAALRDMRATPAGGEPPLEISFDDVTYTAITFKPVRPQGNADPAVRVDFALNRADVVASRKDRELPVGEGVVVGVIDGGFEREGVARTDGWGDNVIDPPDGRPPLDPLQPGVFAPGAGHGTFVTGCVLRHAPEATIRQYRAVDAWGFGSSWRLKDCIKQAVQDGCQVINISLGFEDPDLIGSPAISAALHAVPSSVVVVGAAGNSGTAIPMLPASHTRAVGVGGLKGDLNPVAWSNYGPWVDFSAVAMPVVSLYVEDITDPQQDPWGMWAGTSFAAPKVAGELAGFVGEGAAPSDALDRLRARSARPFPSPDYGYVLDLDDDDAAAYVLAFPPQ
ncbi:MAG: S8/S53 family peptidase [Tetrasphaera jenkinsii]|jgi:hypothetical protein|nr:S8/S53 family peptidase [Tetrasphaera jenkinsii]